MDEIDEIVKSDIKQEMLMSDARVFLKILCGLGVISEEERIQKEKFFELAHD